MSIQALRERRGTIAAALLLTLGTALGSWGLQAEVSRIAPPAPVAPEPPAWAVAGLFAPVGSIAGLPMRRPRTLYVFSMPLPESVRRAAEMHRALTTAKLATPVAAPRLDFGDSAFPEIGSVAPANSAVLTLVPVAPVHVTAPVVPMESKLEPLRLVFSTKPVYPALARRAGTQGEVVIHARVDEAGKVALLRVISGPPALRQAALDALSQWKYAPARLNGKPVTVDTAVNVKFQL